MSAAFQENPDSPRQLTSWLRGRHLSETQTLYIHPVFCTVYLLRENGQRLTADEIKARGGVDGYLVFGQRPVVPEMVANLHSKQGDVHLLLPELQCAEVVKVRDGVLVRGLLVDRVTYQATRQAWWCVPLRKSCTS